MKTIRIGLDCFEVDRQYKDGAYAFYHGGGNPYKNGSKRHSSFRNGFEHAKQGIISLEVSQYLALNKGAIGMEKSTLLKELDELTSKLPKNISSWDAGKTRQYKEALKNAMGKRKSSVSQLHLALVSLRHYYR